MIMMMRGSDQDLRRRKARGLGGSRERNMKVWVRKVTYFGYLSMGLYEV